MIGKTISHYRILEKLGSGGMGDVYKAEDTKLKRTVALKFLPLELTRDEDARKRFVHEARAASALDHANIGYIHEINESDGHSYIAMAYYKGETLKDKIEQGPLPVDEAIDLAVQIARGLAKAHSKDIVHRDIKPANILLTEDGQVKIVDFGLAKLGGQTKLTKTGMTMGTIAYMSPEQTQGTNVDHRTDIWSLGIVLYEMLTGELPFKGEYEQAVLYSILNEEPEFISKLRSDLPQEIETIVEKALAKKADDRFQTMEEMLGRLQTLGEELKYGEQRKRSPIPRLGRKQRRNLYRAVAVVLALVIACGVYLWQGGAVEATQVSIAVLPLKSFGDATEEDWFTDGMTEAIITDLAKIGGMRVISRASVMQFKNTNTTLQAIADDLHVQYVIDGSVMRVGDKIKISAQLLDAHKDEHLWAEVYIEEAANVFVLQGKIAQAVANEVKVKLASQERSLLSTTRQVNPEAHEAYLKGVFHFNKVTPEGTKKSIELFKKAIEIQPDYALAHAALGVGYIRLVSVRVARHRDVAADARQAAQKALEIDETVGLAHRVLGTLKRREADFDGAENHLKRAIELSPSYAEARIIYARVLSNQGRHQEATRQAEIAHRLDPLNLFVSMNLAARYWIAGANHKAIEQTRKVIELDEDFAKAHLIQGFAYLGLQEYEQALAAAEKAYKYSSGNSQLIGGAAYTYAVAGKIAQAEKLLMELQEKAKTELVNPGDIAIIYAGLNDKDKAFEFLSRTYNEGWSHINNLDSDPLFENLRSDPRYEELARKVGLRN